MLFSSKFFPSDLDIYSIVCAFVSNLCVLLLHSIRLLHDMGGHRLSRENIHCPTNKDVPNIKGAEANKRLIVDKSCHSEHFEKDDLIYYLSGVKS